MHMPEARQAGFSYNYVIKNDLFFEMTRQTTHEIAEVFSKHLVYLHLLFIDQSNKQFIFFTLMLFKIN